MKEKIKGKLFFFTREASSPLFLLEWESPVDLLPPLNLYKSSGKLVLERSELGKSCFRQDATLFAEGTKFARDIFCQKRRKLHVTSFVRDAHIVNILYVRAS